jgi:hypothetical protein
MSFAEELSRFEDSDHRFLALFGDNENLDPPLLNIETVSAASPCENTTWFLSSFNMALPSPTLARKSFGSNELFAAFGMKSSKPDGGPQLSRSSTQRVRQILPWTYLKSAPTNSKRLFRSRECTSAAVWQIRSRFASNALRKTSSRLTSAQ